MSLLSLDRERAEVRASAITHLPAFQMRLGVEFT